MSNSGASDKDKSNDAASDKDKDKSNGAASNKDTETEDEDGDDDGIRLDKDLVQSPAVHAVISDPEYQSMKKLTVKCRREQGKNIRFRKMRAPIRSAASAARAAYARAARGEPNTPDVCAMLNVSIAM